MEHQDDLIRLTRRHLFGQCALGLGSLALASLLGDGEALADDRAALVNPLAPRKPHFPPKARSVIYLFMAGGPSQLELFDYKPKLQQYNGEPIPGSYMQGKRFAFMDSFAKEVPKLLGTRRKFTQHGKSGVWVSDCLPQIASMADEIALIRTVTTDVFNHAPAKLTVNTGSAQFGRPSMGAWITYGIGSESQDLPGFVVLQSGPRGPRGGAVNWGSGFLPSTYQGVPFRSGGDPILDLASPTGINPIRQRQSLDALRDLNLKRLAVTGDPEITTRIASYEMAYRMQTSAPELMDLSKEKPETLAMYGAEAGKPSFANNCLLARRLVERGVRFVQLYHTDWDHHGGKGADLGDALDQVCREIDRPCAGLIQDLKQRGLLDQTLIVWGGEFGRTPMGENRGTVGRNHHIDAYSMWMAGGGIKPGQVYGTTDDLGFSVAEGRAHIHDVQATLLHLLGIDHMRLTFRFQGRDFRLTDVGGVVIRPLLV
jgi:hypothetical protein